MEQIYKLKKTKENQNKLKLVGQYKKVEEIK